jgi:hypothetical protein
VPNVMWIYWITIPLAVIMVSLVIWAIKSTKPPGVETKTEIIGKSENLTDTLTRMHRRLVELQDEKFTDTKFSYGQVEKAIPILLDRMNVIKIEDWPAYLRNLKSRIRRATPRRLKLHGSLRQKAVRWVEWRASIQQARISVAREAKAELLKPIKWTLENGVKVSNWIDEHHWGVQDIRDTDQQWKKDFEAIGHYLKKDARLRELITKHIEMSRLSNNACLMERYSQTVPKDSFLTALQEAMVESPLSPVKIEIYLSEISGEIDKQMVILGLGEKELPVLPPNKLKFVIQKITDAKQITPKGSDITIYLSEFQNIDNIEEIYNILLKLQNDDKILTVKYFPDFLLPKAPSSQSVILKQISAMLDPTNEQFHVEVNDKFDSFMQQLGVS